MPAYSPHVSGEPIHDLADHLVLALDIEEVSSRNGSEAEPVSARRVVTLVRWFGHSSPTITLDHCRRSVNSALAKSVWRTVAGAASLVGLAVSAGLLAGIHPPLVLLVPCAIPTVLLASRARAH